MSSEHSSDDFGKIHDDVSATPQDLNASIAMYELLGEIGSSALSVVYKARHRATDREVALKVLQSRVGSNDKEIRRFQKEARLASRLNHPNIVKVFTCGLDDEKRCFLTMEFLEGSSLADRLKSKKPLTLGEFQAIFLPLAEALAYAHEQGIVHRDIKPGNIMLKRIENDLWQPVLVDFGIARALEAESTENQKLTATGVTIGSPAYMSPEQSQAAAVDGRSDIYSFACVMHEALHGVPPFSGENPLDLMYKHINEQPVSCLPAHAHTSMKRLEAIIFRCLEKNPAKRYADCHELRRDLNGCLGDCPFPDLQTLPVLGQSGVSKRIVILALCAAAVLCIGLWAFGRMAERGEHVRTPAEDIGDYGVKKASTALTTKPRFLFQRGTTLQAEANIKNKNRNSNSQDVAAPDYIKAVEMAESIIASAKNLSAEDRHAAAMAATRLSYWYGINNELKQAFLYSKKAESLYAKTDNNDLAGLFYERGIIFNKQKMIDAEMDCYKKAIAAATLNDGFVTGCGIQASAKLAELYFMTGDLKNAKRYYRKCLEDSEATGLGPASPTASRRLRLAYILILEGRAEEAKKLIRKTEVDMKDILEEHYLERAYNCLSAARSLKLVGENKQAQSLLETAVQLAQQEEKPHEFQSKLERVVFFLELERFALAQKYGNEALSLGLEFPDRHLQLARAYKWLALADWRLHDLPKSLSEAESGIKEASLAVSAEADKEKCRNISAPLVAVSGSIYKELKDMDAAERCFKEVFVGDKFPQKQFFAKRKLYRICLADYVELLSKKTDKTSEDMSVEKKLRLILSKTTSEDDSYRHE